jgi:NADH-quinone oxidoreductase subunit J
VDLILFYVFGTIAVVASLLVIGQRSPLYSVLLLIGSFVGLAGLYILLDAPFSAVTQIIVYAGAIMVLFLFVVMLLNTPHEDPPVADPPRSAAVTAGMRRFGVLIGVAFLGQILWAVMRVPRTAIDRDPEVADFVSSVRQIGVELFTTHAFAFELTSILILVAMLGAVVLAKRHL